MDYHVPVMLAESLEGLAIRPDGVYVDVTFGGGGHSRAILEKLDGGRLFSFDQDQDAAKNAEGIDHPGFTFVPANFRFLQKYLRLHGVSKVDGILADIGVSSHQFDEESRGFSFRFKEAELDMRMNQEAGVSAKEVLNEYEEKELHRIFGIYGEVKNAKSLASAIVRERSNFAMETVEDLMKVLESLAPRGKQMKYFAQVFQALRIVVNDELGALENMLQQSVEVLNPEGRLVVISYHSLEDRLVKNFIQKGKFHGALEKDFYGNPLKPLDPVTRKPLIPTEEEILRNPRARSAKFRVAKRNDFVWDETK